MIEAIKRLMNGPPEQTDVPGALLHGIKRLEVLRRHHDADDGDRVAVRIPGLGSVWVDESNGIRERLRAGWPAMSDQAVARAERLIETEIGDRMRQMAQGKPSDRRPSWVWSWMNDG
jgi:hypothetical protein